MSGVATAIVGGSVIGAIGSGLASKSANDSAQKINDDTLEYQERIYHQNRLDFQPYMNLGTNALPSYYAMLGISPELTEAETNQRAMYYDWRKQNPGVAAETYYEEHPEARDLVESADQKVAMRQQIAASPYSGDSPELSPLAQWQSQEFTKSQNRQDAARGLAGSGGAAARVSEGDSAIAAQDYQNSYARILDALKIGSGASASAGASSGVFSNAVGNSGSASMGLALDQGNTNAQLWQGLGGIPAAGYSAYNYQNNYPSALSSGAQNFSSLMSGAEEIPI